MNYKQIIDPVVFLQVQISRLFMEKHNLTPQEFLLLNSKKDILGFLRDGYEIFHLMGDDGILEELDNYLRITDKQVL